MGNTNKSETLDDIVSTSAKDYKIKDTDTVVKQFLVETEYEGKTVKGVKKFVNVFDEFHDTFFEGEFENGDKLFQKRSLAFISEQHPTTDAVISGNAITVKQSKTHTDYTYLTSAKGIPVTVSFSEPPRNT